MYKNRLYKVFIIIAIVGLLFFVSCKQNSNDKVKENAISTVLKTIERLEFDNRQLYVSLLDSVYDFRRRDRALKFQPIALEVRDHTKYMIEFCEILKEISLNKPQYLKKASLIELVYNQFNSYYRIIVKAFDKVNYKIDKYYLISKFSFDTEKYTHDDFRDDYFQSSSTADIELSISALELYLKSSENELLKHCFSSTLYYGDTWGYHCPIVYQNSSILKPGEILEINAGVGEFSRAAQPKITFYGKKSEPNEIGVFLYKQRIGKDTGMFSIPVHIEYTAPDGVIMSYDGTVKYQVKL